MPGRKRRHNQEADSASASDAGPEHMGTEKTETAEEAALRKARDEGFQEELQQLEAERAQILEGNHADLSERCIGLDRSKERRLRDAAEYKRVMTENLEGLVSFEVQQAKEVWEAGVEQQKQRMLGELEERKRKIEALRDDSNSRRGTSEAAPKRSLRSKTKTGEATLEESDDYHDAPKKRYRGFMEPLTHQLTDEEISDDFEFIVDDLKRQARRFMSTARLKKDKQLVRVEGARLCYGDIVVDRGDHVVVASGGDDAVSYHGTVRHVNQQALFVNMANGNPSKVPLQQLRSGRVTVEIENEYDLWG